MGWRDKQEIEHSGNENSPIRVLIQDYGAKDNTTTKATGSPENE